MVAGAAAAHEPSTTTHLVPVAILPTATREIDAATLPDLATQW